jgi:uncharacterized membrane protein
VRLRLLALWDALRSSYWFVPSLMAVGALGLAWLTLRFDQRWDDVTQHVGIFAATPSGARSILSGVAAAMITIAGLTFSITIVAITVASQQYGARLLRNFMRDMINQFVLGVFIAIFLYCLLVLGAIRSEEAHAFIPNLSVTLSVGFAVLGLGVLIYFIHHVSSSIDVARLVDVVGGEIDERIADLFPQRIGEAVPDRPCTRPAGPGGSVAATANGYLQAVDDALLLATACENDVVIRLERRPGDLVVEGTQIATVWDRVDDALACTINQSLILGIQRSGIQDLEFSIHQLVEIAVRALSPGINDPFTAILCVDRLTIALCQLAGRHVPGANRLDADGTLRVITRPWTFDGALAAAFDQIRQNAQTSTAVTARLLEALATLATRVHRPADLAAVLRQATLVERGYLTLPHDPADCHDIRARAMQVRRAGLGEPA